jgi:hypothetical protein
VFDVASAWVDDVLEGRYVQPSRRYAALEQAVNEAQEDPNV